MNFPDFKCPPQYAERILMNLYIRIRQLGSMNKSDRLRWNWLCNFINLILNPVNNYCALKWLLLPIVWFSFVLASVLLQLVPLVVQYVFVFQRAKLIGKKIVLVWMHTTSIIDPYFAPEFAYLSPFQLKIQWLFGPFLWIYGKRTYSFSKQWQ